MPEAAACPHNQGEEKEAIEEFLLDTGVNRCENQSPGRRWTFGRGPEIKNHDEHPPEQCRQQ